MSTQPARALAASVFAFALWGLLLHSLSARAADGAAARAAGDGTLPLSKVVMFNSGVGYFEHQGTVDGNARVSFRFRVEDINDLLKSMILEDRGGGTISTVTYGSRDPITKTLKTFPIDLTDNPTLGRILDQVRGERVEIDAPNALSGVLLGVEVRKREVGANHDVVPAEFLNLLTDQGLRSVPLESIGRIKLLDEKLDADLRQALQVLALGHNTDKKSVTLDLLGNGQRAVRVAYIQATPVWKTSYRLDLDKKSPFLQGWAIVENTTEDDWNNVKLTLMSGRPISYTMDLYEPLYVNRPVEQLNLFGSLRPQTYGQNMAIVPPQIVGDKAAPARQFAAKEKDLARRVAGEMPAQAPAAAPAARDEFQIALNPDGNAAAAGEVGELFQYVIGTPVTLARQKSAMLPIVNESIKGEKVSIYDQSVEAKHPLNGLKLVNSTSLHLMQGPITVFDGGAYAGDAKIDDLPPGAERLISYALDLKTEVAPETKGHPEQITSIKLVKGVMQVARKFTRSTTYTVKNSDAKAKTVLVQYPIDAQWKLVAPEKPSEKTRDKYRFAVHAEPGKPVELVVKEEQVVSQSLGIANLDDNTILYYVNQKEVSPAVKAALQEVIKRKTALQNVVQERQRLEQQIGTITAEQERIRANMAQLDRNTDLYKRYVQKFGTQEDSVEQHRLEIQKLTGEEAKHRQALDEYLLGLNL